MIMNDLVKPGQTGQIQSNQITITSRSGYPTVGLIRPSKTSQIGATYV
jgi:hypothetical protein